MNIISMNVQDNGMEIDLEGVTAVGNVRFFAECKAHDSAIDSPAIQQFGFKYLTLKEEYPNIKGFLFTLSPLNTKAQELWNNRLQKNIEMMLLIMMRNRLLLYSSNIIQ